MIEYKTRFDALSHNVLMILQDKTKSIHKFLRGLTYHICVIVLQKLSYMSSFKKKV